jgi:hypothetical protein
VADRILKLRELRRILASFGIQEDSSIGKGSHTTFIQRDSTGKVTATYPVPTTKKDVLICYIRGCRKKFKLTKEDGILDQEFYGQ